MSARRKRKKPAPKWRTMGCRLIGVYCNGRFAEAIYEVDEFCPETDEWRKRNVHGPAIYPCSGREWLWALLPLAIREVEALSPGPAVERF